MDAHSSGHGSRPEFRLSSDAARLVAERTGAPSRRNRTFLSTEHLSTEAVAAYVDGRLPQSGAARADAHLSACPRCRQEVSEQRDARHALRGSGPIRMPDELRDRLRSLGEGGGVDRGVDGHGAVPAAERSPMPDEQERSPWTRLLRRLRRPGR